MFSESVTIIGRGTVRERVTERTGTVEPARRVSCGGTTYGDEMGSFRFGNGAGWVRFLTRVRKSWVRCAQRVRGRWVRFSSGFGGVGSFRAGGSEAMGFVSRGSSVRVRRSWVRFAKVESWGLGSFSERPRIGFVLFRDGQDSWRGFVSRRRTATERGSNGFGSPARDAALSESMV